MTQKSKRPGGNRGAEEEIASESEVFTTKSAAMPAAIETNSTGAVIALLAERWPKAFFVHEAKRKPLKVGVHLEIIAALDGAVTKTKLAIAIDCYVSNARYLSRCTVAGAKRIDLDGLPSGEVTVKEANYAKNRLSMAVWNAKMKERPTRWRQPPQGDPNHRRS